MDDAGVQVVDGLDADAEHASRELDECRSIFTRGFIPQGGFTR